MKKSKLIDILKSISREEWIRLDDFIRSPYFNKNEELIQLFEYLKTLAPDFNEEYLEKAYVFKQLFPNRPYDKAHFNHLQNYLLRLVEQFIAHQFLKEDTISQNQIILKTYLSSRLGKHYDFKRKQLEKAVAKAPFQDEEYYYQLFQLAKTENERFIVQRQRVVDAAILDSYSALDTFYIIQRLKFWAEILDRQKKFPQSYDNHEFHLLDQLVQQKQFQQNPYILIYRQLIQMLLQEQEEAHFTNFKILLDQYAAQIKAQDLKRLFLFAINYCVRKMAVGEPFQHQLLELYTSGLGNGTLLEYDTLSPWTYKNIVQLGLGLDKTSWVKKFILTYSKKLPSNYKEAAFHFNQAAFYYHQKDYKNAMLYLNQVQYSDISYKLWSKELLVKIYYEIDELEALISLLISFEQLVKRNKQISKLQKEAFMNFLRIMGKLTRRKFKPEQISAEIESLPRIRERKWLLQQV